MKALKKTKQTETNIREAIEHVQIVCQVIQQKVHDQIAEVVSMCLQAVFEDPYEFRIRFDKKRGRTEAVLTFIRDGIELDDPLNEIGGGVIDVASLALRLAAILLSRPIKRRLVILDEPFSNIRGKGNKARTRKMLQNLAEKLDFQIIINTDIEAFRLGKIVEVGNEV
jgi:ABC-type Mn2+/Zn2+ transport system ATPase subunit